MPNALATYHRLIPFADVTYVAWPVIAVDLRAEADTADITNGQRQERLDRAEDCDRRARVRAHVRAQLAALPDFAEHAVDRRMLPEPAFLEVA